MRATALPILLLLAGCRESGGSAPAPPPSDPAPPRAARLEDPPPLAEGESFTLAPGAAGGWRARPVAHAPRYFLAHGWLDDATLWGMSGTNALRVGADRPEYGVWRRGSWDAAPSPDGARLAWADERGVWVEGAGAAPRLLVEGRTLPGGEDLSGPLLWSPDGARLLLRWAGEGVPVHAVVEAATGRTTPLESRGEGYLLVEPFGWLDGRRLLFTAQPRLGTDGAPAPKSDLAEYDVEAGSHRRVTDAAEGAPLRVLARWGDDAVLAGEGTERRWVYETRGWSRRPVSLPPGERVAASGPGRAVVARLLGEPTGDPEYALYLAEGERVTTLGRARGRDLRLSWSPDGRRLLLSHQGGTILLEPAAAR